MFRSQASQDLSGKIPQVCFNQSGEWWIWVTRKGTYDSECFGGGAWNLGVSQNAGRASGWHLKGHHKEGISPPPPFRPPSRPNFFEPFTGNDRCSFKEVGGAAAVAAGVQSREEGGGGPSEGQGNPLERRSYSIDRSRSFVEGGGGGDGFFFGGGVVAKFPARKHLKRPCTPNQ